MAADRPDITVAKKSRAGAAAKMAVNRRSARSSLRGTADFVTENPASEKQVEDAVPHGFAPEQAPDAHEDVSTSDAGISISETVALVAGEVRALIQAERDLLKAKADVAASSAKHAMMWMAIAAVALVAASLASLYAFIALLSPWLGPAGASGLVAIIWIVICIFGAYRSRAIIAKAIAVLKD